jgi:hypothetical protein
MLQPTAQLESTPQTTPTLIPPFGALALSPSFFLGKEQITTSVTSNQSNKSIFRSTTNTRFQNGGRVFKVWVEVSTVRHLTHACQVPPWAATTSNQRSPLNLYSHDPRKKAPQSATYRVQ